MTSLWVSLSIVIVHKHAKNCLLKSFKTKVFSKFLQGTIKLLNFARFCGFTRQKLVSIKDDIPRANESFLRFFLVSEWLAHLHQHWGTFDSIFVVLINRNWDISNEVHFWSRWFHGLSQYRTPILLTFWYFNSQGVWAPRFNVVGLFPVDPKRLQSVIHALVREDARFRLIVQKLIQDKVFCCSLANIANFTCVPNLSRRRGGFDVEHPRKGYKERFLRVSIFWLHHIVGSRFPL